MSKYNIVLLFLSVVCALFSVTDDARTLYSMTTTLTQYEKDFVTDDLMRRDDLALIQYFIMVSGERDRESQLIAFYNEKTKALEEALTAQYGTLDTSAFSADEQKKFAESVLTTMHSVFFTRYRALSDSFGEIADHGYFNCVSSSLLYAILLHRFHVNATGVETKDHVFIAVAFPDGSIDDGSIDVETTNRAGFNPGSKKEFYDQFGNETGFVYVPAQNYRLRNSIDLKKIITLVSQNATVSLDGQKKFMEAARIGYFIKSARKDAKGDDEYYLCFTNLAKTLAQSRNYIEAIDLMTLYIEENRLDEKSASLLSDLMNDFIVDSSSPELLAQAEKMLETQKASYGTLYTAIYQKLFLIIIQKKVNMVLDQGNFEEAYRLISGVTDQKIKTNLVHNAFYMVAAAADKKATYTDGLALLEKSKAYQFDQFADYQYFRVYLIKQYTHFLTDKKKFVQAEAFLADVLITDRNNNELRILYKNAYLAHGYDEARNGNYQKAIAVNREGLDRAGKDPNLLNNLKVSYLKYIDELKKAGKETLAVTVRREAASLFPTEKQFQ